MDSRPRDLDPGPTVHRTRQSPSWSATRFVGRGTGIGWVPAEAATVVATEEWVVTATVTAAVVMVAARLEVAGLEDEAKAQTADLATAMVSVVVTGWAVAGQVAEATEAAAAAAARGAKEEMCQCTRRQDACPTYIERR